MQPKNALHPISTTVLGIVNDFTSMGTRIIILLSFVYKAPFLEQYLGLSLSTTIFERLVQPEKGILSYYRNATGYLYRGKILAAFKGVPSNFSNAAGNLYRGEALTANKGFISNLLHATRNLY